MIKEESPRTTTWMASVSSRGEHEVFYVPECGWASRMLGYHEGIGPYFSLPEALNRVELLVGDCWWQPHRLESMVQR